jgi:hypothetical protein
VGGEAMSAIIDEIVELKEKAAKYDDIFQCVVSVDMDPNDVFLVNFKALRQALIDGESPTDAIAKSAVKLRL